MSLNCLKRNVLSMKKILVHGLMNSRKGSERKSLRNPLSVDFSYKKTFNRSLTNRAESNLSKRPFLFSRQFPELFSCLFAFTHVALLLPKRFLRIKLGCFIRQVQRTSYSLSHLCHFLSNRVEAKRRENPFACWGFLSNAIFYYNTKLSEKDEATTREKEKEAIERW